MSTVYDERARRTARARAVAASIIDRPHVPRRFAPAPDSALRSSLRRRRTAPQPRTALRGVRPRGDRRRLAAILVAAQAAVLVGLLALPTFQARTIQLQGAHLLSRDAILSAAGISPSQSIFTVDGDAIRTRLEHLPWVRSASVETELPSTLRISVVEWTPILREQTGAGEVLLAPGGQSLPLSSVAAGSVPQLPLLVDRRPTPAPADPALVRVLAALAGVFPQVAGTTVARFDWQPDGLLAVVATPGWRAILGHADTAAAVAAMPDQIAALAAVRAKLDLLHPTFGYVDLEDPAAPAVGGTAPSTTAAPATAAHGSGAAAGTPAPTPRPSPTPIMLTVPPSH